MMHVRKIPERLLRRWFVPRQDYAEVLGDLKAVNKALDKAEQEVMSKKAMIEIMKITGKKLEAERDAAVNELRDWRWRCEGYEDCLADIGLEFRKKGNNTYMLAKREAPKVQNTGIPEVQ